MLKEDELIAQAEVRLRGILADVPFIRYPEQQTLFSRDSDDRADLVFEAQVDGQPRTFICEVKRSAEPRQVRDAVLQLRNYVAHYNGGPHVYTMLIAPYLSPESIAICQKAGVGAMDLAGNAWISFDKVFIKSTGNKNPASKRVARALFSAKSARVLRQLLRNPKASWKVTALSEAAKVSLGQVSNVRKILLDREWAAADEGGIRLTRPREVLEAWQKDYLRSRDRTRYYTLLHGDKLEAAIRKALQNSAEGHAVLASFSAARWWAPYTRIATQYMYADIEGNSALIKALALEPAERGENIVIYRPRDEGIFFDSQEAAPGVWCSSPIQTYLDLTASGERGEEAAEHLFNNYIAPAWGAAR